MKRILKRRRIRLRVPRTREVSRDEARALVIDKAKMLERYFSSWPSEMIPVIDKAVIRAVRLLKRKERGYARTR
jgi:hypothetical protein